MRVFLGVTGASGAPYARRLLQSSKSAEAFYDAMLRLHPNRVNPGALWGAAVTLFPGA